jgi:cytoskeletal protein RodZ
MKIHSTHLQLSLWLAACLPLPSHAGIELPYWMYPRWIAAKVIDFHVQNSERYEQAQLLAQAKNNPNGTVNGNANTNAAPSDVSATTNNNEQAARKTKLVPVLAPVETATVKINEKHLTKEELMELRKQLRQKP